MKTDLPKLNQKTLTKLINSKYRKSLLSKLNLKKTFGLSEYAKYVVDSSILQKIPEYEDNAKSGWGFPQLNIICSIKKDGTIEKKLFEFKPINHFLKDKDGDSAVEVVECILALWANEDKSIVSYDYEKIDAELVKLDEQAKELAKKDEVKNEIGKKIKEKITPLFDEIANLKFDDAMQLMQEKIGKVLEQMKDSKEIVVGIVSFNRNVLATINQKQMFVDVGFKVEDVSEQFTVLTCQGSCAGA